MHRSPRGLTCWIVGVIIALGLPVAAEARVAVVTTTDGRTFEGELLSDAGEQVVLLIAGIRTPFDREVVLNVTFKKTVEEAYRARRARLEDDDIEGRYALAYDLFRNNALTLAERELDSLSRRFPDDERVGRLKVVVEQKLRLAARQAAAPPDEAASEPTSRPSTPAAAPSAEPAPRLTAEQINLIRVYEARLDEKPRIQIAPQTLDRFLERYGRSSELPWGREAEAALRRAQGYDQARWFFAVQAREFYPEIIVRDDPPALRTFRTQIHRQYVLNYCGTIQCHGGEQAPGGFYLFQTQPTSDRTVYTNFYVLDQHRNAHGRMLNRDVPHDSLLLQYGMDRSHTGAPHPDVPGWRPQFYSTTDSRFRQYARMIGGLWKPTPNYGLDYTPPGAPAPTPPEEGEE